MENARETTRSPIRKHILNTAIILRQHKLLDLLLREPLVVRKLLCIGLQIGLASHDTTLQEECLFACDEFLGDWVGFGGLEFIRVVTDRVEADEPGVHVDTCGLREGALRRLLEVRTLLYVNSRKRERKRLYRTQILLQPHRRTGKLPVSLLRLDQQIQRPLQQPIQAFLIILFVCLRHPSSRTLNVDFFCSSAF